MDSAYIGILSKALNAYSMRSEAISNNIANVNTPNYKRSYVRFEEYLAKANDECTLKGAKTNSKHIDIPSLKGDTFPTVVKDNSVSTREDGNNVNIDTEEVDSVKNYINYSMIADSMTGYFNSLISGITGGRK
ncbi:flagellar basal-body rod protein FlgB [Peptoanaerobacter stomatis]|jgi:flagellar basal-body rod protein flgB|uniref:Flagellar basal body rod protein FlgB n=1 Tax=Peptoanaerobacter stomatis TaxID=796937 RepID=G9XAJ0_9FIRM|nr:flagellar basal body rod protein FlgB [Peptoanaerobacter stomatis]EHL20010.1 flagellar basal-body rod protein FlgB [Peptoanaerobacter stomatis]